MQTNEPLQIQFTEAELRDAARDFLKWQYAEIYGASIKYWPVEIQDKFFTDLGRFTCFVGRLFERDATVDEEGGR